MPERTRVVNSTHAPKGWKANALFVDVRRSRNGRVGPYRSNPGYFGNPFKISETMPRDRVLALFRENAETRVKSDPDYRDAVRGLAGKTLVCACAPKGGLTAADPHVCHGQILAEIAERLASREAVSKGDDRR